MIERIARDQGVAVILTHPNITDHKLRFVEAVADRWRGRAWMGTVDAFGDWWSNRDALETDVIARNGRWILRAESPKGARDVAIVFPKAAGRRVTVGVQPGRPVETPL